MGQRLREWLRNADEKKGNKRKAIEVTSCFAPLLSWILSQWQPGEQKLYQFSKLARYMSKLFLNRKKLVNP
jgi:hypothetical protein